MCTALSFVTKDHYFGRNLDLEYSYFETVTITPRNYPFHFRHNDTLFHHFAIIGTAYVYDGYPLYYEATNEKGLSMAGLNFPQNAQYKPMTDGKDNITPFELIPWIVGQCETVAKAKILLSHINLLNENFNEQLPLSPLHWMISDKKESIVVESVKEGLKIYDNPIGVLTNNPTFDMQLKNRLKRMDIPGDWASPSRFVKASFLKQNSVCNDSEESSMSQFFHILGGVAYQRGCVHVDDGLYKITRYSSCCNTNKGIYYYRTYENSQITAVDMHKEDLEGTNVISYPLIMTQQIHWQN